MKKINVFDRVQKIREELELNRQEMRKKLTSQVLDIINTILKHGSFTVWASQPNAEPIVKELKAVFHSRNWELAPVRWHESDEDGIINVTFIRNFSVTKMNHINKIREAREKYRQELRNRVDEKINNALKRLIELNEWKVVVYTSDLDAKPITEEMKRVFRRSQWEENSPVVWSNVSDENGVGTEFRLVNGNF